ncbi:BRISC and BRCA1-A complex member 1-like [Anneissia japonica]|uniref:BRISC and BRCA1-A complex member 1-like n=1 Tax=Anneissia japonica TaxID=1529436 RepID=UPI00142553B5|nr:BRISC and BRCA1-A complex member 1-like [Anneissia japonica]
MSDKTSKNPFSPELKTADNKQQRTSEPGDHFTSFSTNERGTEKSDKTDNNVEYSSQGQGLGSEAGNSSKAVQPQTTTESSGLNPFVAVENLPSTVDRAGDDDNESVEPRPSNTLHQQVDESKEVDVHQAEFSFGPQLPKINCKEKIVICFDLSPEVDRVEFIGRDGTPYNPSALIRSVLNVFIQTKNSINPKHEFALVLLQEKAVWFQDFTNDLNDIIGDLYDLDLEKPDCEEFDLTSLFEVLYQNVVLPPVEGDIESLPPPYIIRTIMVYGRSKCIPTFAANRQVCEHFLKSPYFFMDVFYIHETPTDENKCKEVYDVFLDLDEQNRSYINEVGKNITQLHDKMAMFLAHPLQRPYQQHCYYTLEESQEDL